MSNEYLGYLRSLVPGNALLEWAWDASVDNFREEISDGFLDLSWDSIFNVSVWVIGVVVLISLFVGLKAWGCAVAVAWSVNSTSVGRWDGVAFTISLQVLGVLRVVPLATAWFFELFAFLEAWLLAIPGVWCQATAVWELGILLNVSCSLLVVLIASVSDFSSVGCYGLQRNGFTGQCLHNSSRPSFSWDLDESFSAFAFPLVLTTACQFINEIFITALDGGHLISCSISYVAQSFSSCSKVDQSRASELLCVDSTWSNDVSTVQAVVLETTETTVNGSATELTESSCDKSAEN